MHDSKTFPLALGLALLIGLSACASSSQLRLVGNPAIPAAQGTVKVSTTENGNTSVQLAVKHLARPELVVPGATVYLVWVRPLDRGANAVSLGALQVNENLEGEIATATPLRAFDLFITAEAEQLATLPSGKELLTARVQMRDK